ncbi:MAG: T9SS type A sorting domain-containing protein [Chitinophagales bacterium]|nr:T9SS type A sorting domain-containing protein [Chitinophagales bacterium]
MPKHDINESIISVYPNPTDKEFTIVIPETYSLIEVCSMTGTVLDVLTASENQFVFGKNYAPGIYLLKTVLSNGQKDVIKLIKI